MDDNPNYEPPPMEPPQQAQPVLEGTSRAGFRIDDWAGYPNYHCPHCDFASLNEDYVIDHILEAHQDQA